MEWDVENAKEIRIDGGLPVVRRGRKKLIAKETITMKVVFLDGRVEESVLKIDIVDDEKPILSVPDTGGSKLRGLGVKIGRK